MSGFKGTAFRGTAGGARWVLGLCATAVAGTTASAAILQVPEDYPTIQAAVNAASPGDEVQIGPGTYTGDGNRDVWVAKSLTIRGASADLTILQVEGQGGAYGDWHNGFFVWLSTSEEATLADLTVTGGVQWGGAVSVGGDGKMLISACKFAENRAFPYANTYGGAIYVDVGVSVRIESCEFQNNWADVGGALFIDEGSHVAILDSRFSGNLAGAGPSVEVRPHCDVAIADCSFEGELGGDGVIHVWQNALVVIRRSVFSGGEASSVVLNAGSVSLEEVTVTGNLVGDDAAINTVGPMHVENSIIWGNCAVSGGYAEIHVRSGGSCDITCSVINPVGLSGAPPTYHEGVILGDPLLCAIGPCGPEGAHLADLRLQPDSPCIPSNNACIAWMGAVHEVCAAEPTGACCQVDGSCIEVTPSDCAASSGVYQGDGVACADATCGGDVPTERTTWGRIKARMR